LPSTKSSANQNSTLKEINSLQCSYLKQDKVHINNNDYQLNERNNKNEIFFPNDISSKQHNSNLKKRRKMLI